MFFVNLKGIQVGLLG